MIITHRDGSDEEVQLLSLLIQQMWHRPAVIYVDIWKIVFKQLPTTRADLIDRITQAFAALPRETLLKTVWHFLRRLHLSSSKSRQLWTFTYMMLIITVKVRGNGTRGNKAPQKWKARWLTVIKHPKSEWQGTHGIQKPQKWKARGLTVIKHPKENTTYYVPLLFLGISKSNIKYESKVF